VQGANIGTADLVATGVEGYQGSKNKRKQSAAAGYWFIKIIIKKQFVAKKLQCDAER